MEMKQLACLEIWNNQIYLLPVLGFLDNLAAQVGGDFSRYHRLRYAFGELLRRRIENAYPGKHGKLYVELYSSETLLELSIRDKGVPGWYDFSYDPDEITHDKTALQNFALDRCVDGIGIEKLGQNGQRIYVQFRIKNPVHFKKPEPYPEMTVLDTNITIHPVETKQDANEAIRCIYSEYGYSYAYEQLYYVDSFLRMIRDRELISFLAVNDHGQTAGHFALSFSGIYKNMPEISSVVIRREFRGLKLFPKFVDHCIKVGKEQHFRALMGQPVAYHTASQKVILSAGFTATSLLMSYINAEAESEYNPDQTRQDLCVGVYIMDPAAQSTVYPPQELLLFIQKVYDRLGWKYEIRTEHTPAENTQISINDNSLLKITKIILNESGEDFEDLLKKLVRDTIQKKNEMIELIIRLDTPSCTYGYEAAKNNGFTISGVIPGGENGDYLMMQLLLGDEFDYDRLVMFGEFEEIRDDITALVKYRRGK